MTPDPKYFVNLAAISCKDGPRERKRLTYSKKYGGIFIRLLLFASTGKRAPLVAPTRMTKIEPILRWKWESPPPLLPQFWSFRV